MTLKPQPGPQTEFCAASASLVIYGGAAGGGKSYALLLEAARYIGYKNYSAILFRRTYPQIKNPGALWDTAVSLYSEIPGSVIKESSLTIEWPKYNSKITFSHMQREADKLQHQGAQYPFIGFDEVTGFEWSQFVYLFSRNRLGMCEGRGDIRPCVRATCNPEPGWLRDFLAPWVDPKYPAPARSGEVRYFWIRGDQVEWGIPGEFVLTGDPLKDPKSCSFIRSSVYDNKALLEADPGYLQQLASLPAIERARLLQGRWDVEDGDRIFDRSWFKVTSERPAKFRKIVRYWDLAGTSELEKNGYRACYTAGALVAQDMQGAFWLLDMRRFRESGSKVQQMIVAQARLDHDEWGDVEVVIEQEPGSAGKFVVESYARELAGHNFKGDRPTGAKEARWQPMAAQARAGNFYILQSNVWNGRFLAEVEDVPFGEYKDQVDAAAGGFAQVAVRKPFLFR